MYADHPELTTWLQGTREGFPQDLAAEFAEQAGIVPTPAYEQWLKEGAPLRVGAVEMYTGAVVSARFGVTFSTAPARLSEMRCLRRRLALT